MRAAALELPLWSVAPFVVLLLAIAILPLAAPRFWESHRNKLLVALLCGVPVAVFVHVRAGAAGIALGASHPVVVSLRDYVSFLLLLFALYVISGGVRVAGTLAGTPTVNAGLLAIGSLLASVVGTTGASMLLVRPLLRANAVRKRKTHVVLFFIFVVSNCGGLLTPLGDPPLFLGFMKGVSFGWTIRLFAPWLLVNGLLIVVFHFLDSHWFHREDVEEPRGAHDLDRAVESARRRVHVEGSGNLLLLAGVVATLFLAGTDGAAAWPAGAPEGAILLLTLASIFFTPKSIRRDNQFSYAPVVEVAVLFLGIFLAMVPALEILNQRGAELPLAGPRAFFWATGALSSFLDNAPTYLTFAAVAAGRQGVTTDGAYLARFLALGGDSPRVLAAISCGAVFMGALTYIGNGPNFMVKAIAEHHHVKMPSFLGYMAWSCAVLLPIFVVVTFAFF
jgi:Na+/H+ antiporter NhaD/arsenite permease-like protein